MKKILFYLAQEYYWPSLKPVYDEFSRDGRFDLQLMIEKQSKRYLRSIPIPQRSKIEKKFRAKGYRLTRQTKGFDAVFCGAQIQKPQRFGNALLCNLDHGPGIKTLRYRHFLKQPHTKYICFVEGKYRIDKFKKYGLDKIEELYDVGLPKLDVLFNGSLQKNQLLQEFSLDPAKKTILYAPSYKPTSIFMIGGQVSRLSKKYNVIVKLHPYSWSGKYAPHTQHIFFEKLAKIYPDMYLVPPEKHDILPFIFVADTMISDGSSVINEFLSLERCGIIVDLEENEGKHSDGQPLLEERSAEWLKEAFVHISSAGELEAAIETALNPGAERLAQIAREKQYVFSHTDGFSSRRVKEKTEQLMQKKANEYA